MRIRTAVASDRALILGLAPRLVEFGQPAGRDAAQMIERDREVLAASLDDTAAGSEIFVAENDDGVALGFIHLTTANDYYANSETAHVADIIVTEAAARHGVGTALLDLAEDWARRRGFAMLTLNVFLDNHGARALYERCGFREEWIRCIKTLSR